MPKHTCAAILVETGLRCGNSATIVDHVRTGDTWPPVWICGECAARDYPNQFTPIVGEQLPLLAADGQAAKRLTLVEAECLADEVITLLQPFAERLEIGGSLRRRMSTVGSLDVVAVAIRERGDDPNAPPIDRLDLGIRSLCEAGTFERGLDGRGRQAFGPVYKRLTYQGITVNVFSVSLTSWGLQLAIRTGPESFSKRLVTPRKRGGLLPEYLLVRDNRLWRTRDRRSLPAKPPTRKTVPEDELELVPVPDERSLFQLLAMNYLEPERRR